MKSTAYAPKPSRKTALTTVVNMESKRRGLLALAPELTARMPERMPADARELAARDAGLPTIRIKGERALRRLLHEAQQDTGQSMVIARFLLNLYDGYRFPFDMTDLRRLDHEVFDDCVAVIRMDFHPQKGVHLYFENGIAIWEALAKKWGFTDYIPGTCWR